MSAQFIEYGVFLPEAHNDGRPVPRHVYVAIEDALVEEFSGFMRAGNLVGAWRAPDGTVYLERMFEYRIAAISEGPVLHFAWQAGVLLEQKAVYVRLPDNRVVIVPVDL